MERRLTTILTADVAGYSRLMEADEKGTFSALQAVLNEVVRPRIDQFSGRIVKLMGDGLLAEFASVVDAVQFSLSVQDAVEVRMSGLPEHKRFRFRIGIHLGDVIVEGDDIHGDGVNVAARLETLAQAGSICISQQVMDQVQTKTDVVWHDLGQCQVKNIVRPIHAYCSVPAAPGAVTARGSFRPVVVAAVAAVIAVLSVAGYWMGVSRSAVQSDGPPAEVVARNQAALPSLVVLPFASLSPEQDQEYLADGITDDLITDLAKVSGLLVIARESSFTYKGGTSDLKQVAEQLGVRYVVQGSLRRAGGRIRINAQLVDTETGAHVWAERYDRDTEDIFALQDDVRGRIVAALKVKLTPEEAEQLAQPITTNPDAYDAYLRARQQESFFTRDSTLAAIRLYHEALELDPDFVTAKARLATAYTMAVEAGWMEDPNAALELARSFARETIAKDGNLPLAYWALARVYTRKEFFDGDKAIANLRHALEIDPNYADGHAMLANTLHLVGRAEEGLSHIETAMRLNPHFPFWYYYALAVNQFHLTRFEAAEDSLLKAVERNGRWRPPHILLISTYGHLGRPEDAEWEMEELRALGMQPTISALRETDKIQDDLYRARFFEGLEKAGMPET